MVADVNITIWNRSSETIWYVYISPSSASDWGTDRLGSAVIGPDEVMTFTVNSGTYDIKVEDSNHISLRVQYDIPIQQSITWEVR